MTTFKRISQLIIYISICYLECYLKWSIYIAEEEKENIYSKMFKKTNSIPYERLRESTPSPPPPKQPPSSTLKNQSTSGNDKNNQSKSNTSSKNNNQKNMIDL